MAFESYTLQGCPNLAHDKLSRSTKDIPSPRKTRSVSESRFTRHFNNGKTRPAKPPDAPTIPIGAAHILFSGQHQMRHPTSKTRPRVSPRWRCKWLWFGPTLRQALARGAIIKMTLERATPKGKVGGGEANGKSQCWALLEEFYSKRTVKGVP